MFACGWSDSQGPEPAGDRASRRAEKVTEYVISNKYYKITNRVSGPPVGEASARSAPTLRFGSVEWKGVDGSNEVRG